MMFALFSVAMFASPENPPPDHQTVEISIDDGITIDFVASEVVIDFAYLEQSFELENTEETALILMSDFGECKQYQSIILRPSNEVNVLEFERIDHYESKYIESIAEPPNGNKPDLYLEYDTAWRV